MKKIPAAKDPARNVWLQLGLPDAEEHYLAPFGDVIGFPCRNLVSHDRQPLSRLRSSRNLSISTEPRQNQRSAT
jgi:hypothetical protein